MRYRQVSREWRTSGVRRSRRISTKAFQAARPVSPVSPLNGSNHKVSTVAPFCTIVAAYYTSRSRDRRKPEAQARQFGAKETQPLIICES